MRKVLDANCFQDPMLEEYLRASPANVVVFTDFACMESYKPSSLANIHKSLQIVSRYPSQVVVLKPTREIIQLQDRRAGVGPEDFVDPVQTNGFAEFCTGMRLASEGHPQFGQETLAIRREALRHFDRMLLEVRDFASGVALMKDSLRPEHVRALRERAPLSAEDARDTIKMILLLAATFFDNHPDVTALPKEGRVLRETHIFRFAVAAYVLDARWISDGGPAGVKHTKLRNDVVDLNYIAFATFFDGLLSRDKKMLEIYEETRWLLDEVFVAE